MKHESYVEVNETWKLKIHTLCQSKLISNCLATIWCEIWKINVYELKEVCVRFKIGKLYRMIKTFRKKIAYDIYVFFCILWICQN